MYSQPVEIQRTEKMATGFLQCENPKTLKKTHRRVLKTSNPTYAILLVQGQILQKKWFSLNNTEKKTKDGFKKKVIRHVAHLDSQ